MDYVILQGGIVLYKTVGTTKKVNPCVKHVSREGGMGGKPAPQAMELDDKVRGKHVVAERAHEMRGRVAILGSKGSKVVCVVYPSMLNNL